MRALAPVDGCFNPPLERRARFLSTECPTPRTHSSGINSWESFVTRNPKDKFAIRVHICRTVIQKTCLRGDVRYFFGFKRTGYHSRSYLTSLLFQLCTQFYHGSTYPVQQRPKLNKRVRLLKITTRTATTTIVRYWCNAVKRWTYPTIKYLSSSASGFVQHRGITMLMR